MLKLCLVFANLSLSMPINVMHKKKHVLVLVLTWVYKADNVNYVAGKIFDVKIQSAIFETLQVLFQNSLNL